MPPVFVAATAVLPPAASPNSPFQVAGDGGTVFSLTSAAPAATVVYALNGGPPANYTGPFTVPTAGLLRITAWALASTGEASATVAWEYFLTGAHHAASHAHAHRPTQRD